MEQQKISDTERKLYRQINYLVMREMWQAIRKKAKMTVSGEKTIYDALHVTRARYTRAIDGEPIRFKNGELYHLSQITGIRSEIFEGADYFKFQNISLEDWKELFSMRLNTGEDEKEREEFKKKYMQTVHEYYSKKMVTSDFTQENDMDLYRFAVYLKFNTPMTDINTEVYLNELTEKLKGIRLEQLEQCNLTLLKNYLNALKQHMKVVNVIVEYRGLKKGKAGK